MCKNCHKTNYINCSAAAGCYLYDKNGSVLIAQRARDPWKGQYDNPGGFVDVGDLTAEDTVVRELYEELGISIDKKSLRYLTTEAMFYEYQDRQTPVMAILYTAFISEEQKKELIANDDVSSVMRVSPDDFDPSLMSTTEQAKHVLQTFQHAKAS